MAAEVVEAVRAEATPEEEKRILRKIDFQYGEPHLCSSVFYFGYLFWSWPSSYISIRFPLGKYLGASVALWIVVLATHAACTNFGGLLTAQFFLDVTEAAVAPGFSLITGMFYKTSEQPSRMALWFLGNAVANIIAGLIAYGIGKIDSNIASWKLLFIILGCVTTAYGILLVFVLPNSPSKAWFRKAHEKKMAVHRTVENRTGLMDEGVFRADQMVDALTDPQAWLLVGYSLTQNIPNGGLFSSIIINGVGFSELNSLLLSAPGGGIQILHWPNTLPDSNRWERWAGIFLLGPFATSIPISLSLITSNVGGLTKKATVSAVLFLAYCTGNIIGPQLFLDEEAPKYPTGLRGVLVGFALAILFLALLYIYYECENRRRDRKHGPVPTASRHQETETTDYVTEMVFINRTDRQIPSFRYTLKALDRHRTKAGTEYVWNHEQPGYISLWWECQ
ncbi:major facilitator superfamily domain-containing protein [Aspergillus foveolatus]|uniref:major facilitator superfamily domain-containing protein n=1 Tax=Aspergillus foveolatus TaxID=210207 RepID=UPI003CCDC7F6